MSFKTALGLLLLAMLAMVAAEFSSWGKAKEKGSYSYDLSSKSDLNKLYNSKVYLAERFTRPLEGMSFQLGVLSHSGVRVTLEDGSKWLVHKGNNFGISSQTVVVDGRHMSSKWQFKEAADFKGSKTVSDFVKAGGTDYHILFDNCHKAAKEMMKGINCYSLNEFAKVRPQDERAFVS
ncbi:hypothetical protein Q8A67_007608 [Cirrhinus molitorella]|uniref:Uncharacterized protein n=1 Tax=Cirrhinus molitorella TaxID=172907 RepID=A0AA88Q7J3_9TELE|nr:hypothetical protein Q8A67_007608 [Cirrhinus molitorella]